MGSAFLHGQSGGGGGMPDEFTFTANLLKQYVRKSYSTKTINLTHDGTRYYVIGSVGDFTLEYGGADEHAVSLLINGTNATNFDVNTTSTSTVPILIFLAVVKNGSTYDLCKFSDGSVVVSGVTQISITSIYANKGAYISVSSFVPA